MGLTVEENTDNDGGLHRELKDDWAQDSGREGTSHTIAAHPDGHHVKIRNVGRAISFWSRLHAMSFNANLGEDMSVFAMLNVVHQLTLSSRRYAHLNNLFLSRVSKA